MPIECGFLLTVLLLCLCARCMDSGCEEEPDDLRRRALRIHDDAVVIDTHSDTTQRMLDPAWRFMERHDAGHMDYPRIREGGLDAVFLSVYLGRQKKEEPGLAVRKALEQFDAVLGLPERNPEEIELARTAGDIRRIAAKGRLALLIGVEGGHLIENDLEILRRYYRLGARYMTLTHSFHHDWADSAGIWEPLPPRHGGLTRFGRDVVREMNRIGMMVDLSHVSDETFFDALEVSDAPVVATHSGARALCDSPRNLTDDMIRALAARGGVVQVVFFTGFLDPGYLCKQDRAQRQWEEREREIRRQHAGDSGAMQAGLDRIREELPMEGAPLSLLIDHIEHIIDLVGPDHAGLGSDWDGMWSTLDGLEDCSKLPRITLELLKRGHGETEIRKILGGNLLRVMEEVETAAARLNSAPTGPARPA